MIPVVFAFDDNLAMPAAVCIYSLFANANPDTRYAVYIMHREGVRPDMRFVDKVFERFPRHTCKLVEVDGTFDSGFEIRGITTPAYYRLLIPRLIREHDKVIYSDVDVIFRNDLSEIYASDLEGNYLAGVNNLAHIDRDLNKHYGECLGLDVNHIICSGFLIMDVAAMRRKDLVDTFINLSREKFKFQDQDVLNISCAGHIKMLAPKHSLLTYLQIHSMQEPSRLAYLWSDTDVSEALREGNIHYNGVKPWQGWCLNFDIWWEYYRRSPVYDPEFYFKFY